MRCHIIRYNILGCQVFFWFGLLLYVQVNSYGHVGMVSSSNHTFFLGNLEQADSQYLVDQQFHKDYFDKINRM